MDEKDLLIQNLKRKLALYENSCAACKHFERSSDEFPCVECCFNYSSKHEDRCGCTNDSCGIDYGDDGEYKGDEALIDG